jgi:TolB-like protein/tRNA A-37 threonylcarbamoyl transferase component Bud32/Flp pilus assembly protein TadD
LPDLLQRLQDALSARYRIERTLGRGGMATVFLAEDLKHRRRVAIKVLDPEVAADIGPERFLREIETVARLTHPHILPLHDSGAEGGLLFYVMPYVDGESLRHRLNREKQLPLEDALRIAREVAGALSYAHSRGLVHRDIKPENVLLEEGHAVLADFGVARVLASVGDEKLTLTGVAVGTPSYMSPEQVAGGSADARSDVYALGCVLYEMLAGQAPFTGPTAESIVFQHLNASPPRVTLLRPSVPSGVEQLISKALAKTPADRFATSAEFADAAALPSDLTSVRTQGPAGESAHARKGPPSVAVLPFVDMSPAKDQEYLGDGIAEELINALVRVQDLRVVARTSAFAFKGAKVDVREIGHRLNVDTVLEGSVRIFGNRLRVTAQLISVADGFHLWSERFDREMVDVFAIQDEISLALVAKLKGELLAGEEAALRRRSTADHEAYNLYLKGLHFLYRPGPESLAKASSFFRDAVAKDPDFALAHAGIATVYANLGILNLEPPAQMLPKAKAALLRALELDPDLAEAHLGSAVLAFWFEWEWDEAERSMERALALNPGNATAYGTRAWLRLTQRRFDDAIRDIDKALSLDPLKPIFYTWSVGLRTAAGRLDEALTEFDKAVVIDPRLGLAYFHAGVAYVEKGLFEEATRALERGRELAVVPGWAEGLLGLVSLKQGDTERASRVLQEMIEAGRTSNVSATSIAWLAAALGRYDDAFAYLDKAYDDRDTLMAFLPVYTKIFSSQLCSDPRYDAVLRKMRIAR